MTADVAVYRRVLRRETHAARTWPAVIVAVIVTALLIVGVVIGVWALADERVLDSADALVNQAGSAVDASSVSIVAGAALLVLAAILIGFALVPGRLNRRARVADRFGLLVDDGVLADAVADEVAQWCGVPRSQVTVTVRRRSVTVRVVPTSGISVDRSGAQSAASHALQQVGFDTPVRVVVAEQGRVS